MVQSEGVAGVGIEIIREETFRPRLAEAFGDSTRTGEEIDRSDIFHVFIRTKFVALSIEEIEEGSKATDFS